MSKRKPKERENYHRECGMPWSEHTWQGPNAVCPDQVGMYELPERPHSGPFVEDPEDDRD